MSTLSRMFESDRVNLKYGLPLLVGLTVLPMILPGYLMSSITLSLIYGVLAMSLGFLISYTGLVDFGHPAYFGIAAYAVAIIANTFSIPIAASMLLTCVFVSAIAFLVAHVSIQTTGIYFAIIQLIFLLIVQKIISSWTSVTGGAFGYYEIQTISIHGVNIESATHFYYIGLIVLIASYAGFRYLLNTPYGDVLIAIRDNEKRVEYLGYNTNHYKRNIFTLSALVAAVTGMMYTYFMSALSPEIVSFHFAGELFLAVLVGGLYTLAGPVVGMFSIEIAKIILSNITEKYYILFGIALVVIVMYFPRGILPAVRKKTQKSAEVS
jgi:ABC-type branched-subunit amino acid transport system permease subunit